MRKATMIVFQGFLFFPIMIIAQDVVPSEQQKLQETWQVLRQEYDGNDENTEDIRFVIAPSKIIIKDKRGERTISYNLDPSMKPKTIDLTLPSDKTPLQMTGIYQLDGDTLKICYGEKGQTRPTEYASRKGSRLTLLVLKRVKP